MPGSSSRAAPAGHPPMSFLALLKQHVYLSRFAFTLFVPMMSAAAVTPHQLPDMADVLVIIVVAWGFHMTFYGMNDVTDYELDKLLGRKDDHPLVRGEISRRTALIITLAHTASVFVIEALSGTTPILMFLLAVACGGVIIYDVFSKRNHFPPLTDAIESIGFAALSLYGAMKAGVPGPLAFTLAVTFGVFLNFITGSFLGIVDVAGDTKGKALTTPIWFGTRSVKGSSFPYIPRSLSVFGLLQVAALIFLNLLPLVRNDFGYPPGLQNTLIAITVILSLAISAHIIRFVVSGFPWQRMPQDIDLDLIAAYSVVSLAVSYWAYLVTPWIVVLGLCVAIPLVISKLIK